MKADLKCVLLINGVLYVPVHLIIMMQELPVGIWGTLQMVSHYGSNYHMILYSCFVVECNV